MYGHGSLDLKFVHGRAESVLEPTRFVQKRCTHQRLKLLRKNNRTTSFGGKGLFICGHICLCNQLLPQLNSCCQEVMQNNEMTSPSLFDACSI